MQRLIVNSAKTASRVTFKKNESNDGFEEEEEEFKHFASLCLVCQSIKLYRCRKCRIWVCHNCDLLKHKFVPKGTCKLQNIKEMVEENRYYSDRHNVLMDLVKSKLKESLEVLNEVARQDTIKIERLYKEISQIREGLSQTTENIHFGDKTMTDLNDLLDEDKSGANDSANVDTDGLMSLVLSDKLPTLQKILDYHRSIPGVSEFTAVQEIRGAKRWARVEVHDDRLLIYSLEKKSQLNFETVVNYTEIQELLGQTTPSKTFFTLRWGGSDQGQIIIKVFPNFSRAANFSLVCSGEYGVSYRNTCFLWVGKRGRPGEFIEGGDYENNDGTGGASIMPIPHNEDVIERTPKAGLVMCLGNYDKTGSLFYINLRDDVGVNTRGIGEVVEGLDLLQKAAEELDKTIVQISDCGHVIEF